MIQKGLGFNQLMLSPPRFCSKVAIKAAFALKSIKTKSYRGEQFLQMSAPGRKGRFPPTKPDVNTPPPFSNISQFSRAEQASERAEEKGKS
jgi:hypothetical protein